MNSGSKSLLDFIQTPVLVGDPDGRVIYVNPAFETDFLVPVEEVAGLPVANLFDGGGREAVLHAVARVCGSHAQCDSASFSLFVADRGYKALASSVQTDGGRVGVILLLLREGASDARLQSFQREILAPLDELTACLGGLAEFAERPDPHAHKLAVADGVRAVERIRKWAGGVAESLKGARKA